MAYGYENGMDVQSDASRPLGYGLSGGGDGLGLQASGGARLRLGGLRAQGGSWYSTHPGDADYVEPMLPPGSSGGVMADAASLQPRNRVASRGDSWARIARQEYGDERYAVALAQANGATSTNLPLGATVQLPDLTGANLKQGGAFLAADAAMRVPTQAMTTGVDATALRATKPLGDEIAPLPALLETVDQVSGRAEATNLAKDYARRAEVLTQSAAQAKAGGNTTMARAYEKAASNYMLAIGEADRAGSSFIDGASIPRAVVNPPEFKVPAGWSYMGQNNVGKPTIAADYLSVNANLYVFSGGFSVNLHDGDFFGQWALGRSYPNYSVKPGLTFAIGNIIGSHSAAETAQFLKGASAQVGHFAPLPIAPMIGAGGGLNHSYGGKTAVEFGFSLPPGSGASPVGYGFETKK